MTDWSGVEEPLLDLLRDTASNVSTFVDDILDGGGAHNQYGGTDGRDTLVEIMRNLVALCDSKEAAVEWLFNAVNYTGIAGGAPYLSLENGNFWSLSAMLDWLKIINFYKDDCSTLIEKIFRDADYADWGAPKIFGIPASDSIMSEGGRVAQEIGSSGSKGSSRHEDVPGG